MAVVKEGEGSDMTTAARKATRVAGLEPGSPSTHSPAKQPSNVDDHSNLMMSRKLTRVPSFRHSAVWRYIGVSSTSAPNFHSAPTSTALHHLLSARICISIYYIAFQLCIILICSGERSHYQAKIDRNSLASPMLLISHFLSYSSKQKHHSLLPNQGRYNNLTLFPAHAQTPSTPASMTSLRLDTVSTRS